MSALQSPVEDQLADAFDVATREVERDDLEVVQDVDVPGRVGAVTIPGPGAALVLNDANATAPIDEALAQSGWESGTARLVDGGLRVSVWEADS